METAIISSGLRQLSNRPAQLNDSMRCRVTGLVTNEARPLEFAGPLCIQTQWRYQPEGNDDNNSRH